MMADSLSRMSRYAPGADLFRVEKVEWMVMTDYRYLQGSGRNMGRRNAPSLSFAVLLASWLRTLTALQEDQNSIHNTHLTAYNCL